MQICVIVPKKEQADYIVTSSGMQCVALVKAYLGCPLASVDFEFELSKLRSVESLSRQSKEPDLLFLING